MVARGGRLGERVEAQADGNASGEVLVDVAEVGHHACPDPSLFTLAQLEHEGVDDVGLLDRGLADVELTGLAVVIAEALRPHPLLGAVDHLVVAAVAAAGIFPWAAGYPAPRVGLVVDPAHRVGAFVPTRFPALSPSSGVRRALRALAGRHSVTVEHTECTAVSEISLGLGSAFVPRALRRPVR